MPRNSLAPDSTRGLALWDRVAEPPPAPAATPRAIVARDKAIDALTKHSGEDFIAAAADFVLAYLRNNGPTSGEIVTDACKAAGIQPHDDRAFGPVYMRLVRRGKIVKAGFATRMKGHASGAAPIWRVAEGGRG